MIVMEIATDFSLNLFVMLKNETPAEYASKQVVVTVDSTTTPKAITPKLTPNKIAPMSEFPITIAAPSPMIYIKELPKKYPKKLPIASFLTLEPCLV
ncbi:hypothetical protein SDC9_175045 [bioreactor metagenome]|uniref:Uncharacterized protein n=1 Tax=bioreactor metagenome TaxID=1076179 RepID=A0A645GKY0_9ZZZZ